MEVKNSLQAAIIRGIRPVDKVERDIKSDKSDADRDANGQQFGGNEHKPPMSDEQFKKALAVIEDLQAVKDGALSIKVQVDNGARHIQVFSQDGKLVRRIRELDLWSLLGTDDGTNRGKLINKSA